MNLARAFLVLLFATIFLWVALAVPSVARTQVVAKNRKVTITVFIDGMGIDKKTEKEWKDTAEKMWNDAFKSNENPYKDCFSLELVLDIEGHDFNYYPDPTKPGRHMIFRGHGKLEKQVQGRISPGNPYKSSLIGYFDETLPEIGIPHEIGHLLGLRDEYKDDPEDPRVTEINPRVTKPWPGRKNTLMADGGRIDKALLERLVSRLRSETHNIPDCTKRWTGAIESKMIAGDGVTFLMRDIAQVQLSASYDGQTNISGTFQGHLTSETPINQTRDGKPICPWTTEEPARFSGRLSGSYTPGQTTMSLQVAEFKHTPGRKILRCSTGTLVHVLVPPGFESIYFLNNHVLENLQQTTENTFEKRYEIPNTVVTVTLRPAPN